MQNLAHLLLFYFCILFTYSFVVWGGIFTFFFFFFIFLGVYASVIGGADSRSLRREPFTNFIEEEFFASNI